MTTTENHCACGRPSRDATLCPACAYQLNAAIAEVADGLADDLDVSLSRQARLGDRAGSRPTEKPIPYDARASEAAHHLKGVLVSWARVYAEEAGADLPSDTLVGIAAWLRPRVGWLRHHAAGAEAHAEILEAVQAARRVIDRPAERLYAGACDCGEDLYAKLGAPYVICQSETHEQPIAWEVEARRLWLLESARDILAPAADISRALNRYAQPVTPAAIRGYVHRGQLASRGERVEGGRTVPVYRLGDVLDILARQAERASA